MAHLTSSQVTLGKTASFLGIIQGGAWFIMSLLCIIEFSIEKPPEFANNYLGNFNNRIYHMYLYKDANLPPGTIVTPVVFMVFMGTYIVLTTMWMVTSVFQIYVLRSRSLNLPVVFKDWGLITLLISFVDFILVVLLAADYDENCLRAIGEDICINTVIPVLVIAARGFALWFVNIFVAWLLIKNAKRLRKGSSYKGTFGGILPIYRPVGQIPRVYVSSAPSLYSQQVRNVYNEKNYWNVNLRTAMDGRTPPVTPSTPRDRQFFDKF